MLKRLIETLGPENLEPKAVKSALKAAYLELKTFKQEIKDETKKTLAYIKENKIKGIVLAGRPYHLDKEINHGIDDMIHGYGFAILCEDGFSDLEIERPLRVVDQWVYHTRLYKAASYVAKDRDLELIQLNSFGCGLDAVTTDQVQEILHQYGKLYTTIKIDEINNLGAARIRVRSLMAAIHERSNDKKPLEKIEEDFKKIPFTKEMKKNIPFWFLRWRPFIFSF